ncbi:TadE-like [Candidatus Nanopelagicaceae bacterium]
MLVEPKTSLNFQGALASLRRRLFSFDRGSASVEFSLLAIPLFIPLFIFMAQFSHSSDAQDSLRTLARESARAFVSSKDDETAFYVADQVVVQGAKLLGYDPNSPKTSIELRIACDTRPCIAANNRVLVQLTLNSSGKSQTQVAAIEYVSPWA